MKHLKFRRRNSHSGYSSCTKCTVVGHFETKPHENVTIIRDEDGQQRRPRGRIVFPEVDSPLRTDQSFRERRPEDHHVIYCCFEEIPR